MSNSKPLVKQTRDLVMNGNLETTAPLLKKFQLNDFDLLAGRVNGFCKKVVQGVLSISEEFQERNKLASSIMLALNLYEEEQLKLTSIDTSEQRDNHLNIADAFIHNLEKQITMESQTQSGGRKGPKIKTYYYLEDQILNYTSFIKVIETLESHHAQYGTEMPKLIKQLNDKVKQLGELLDSSGNTHSEIRQEVKLVYDFSERIRAKLLNAIQSNKPVQIYKTIDGNEKLQLKITLNRLVDLLQSKMKQAEGFSMN